MLPIANTCVASSQDESKPMLSISVKAIFPYELFTSVKTDHEWQTVRNKAKPPFLCSFYYLAYNWKGKQVCHATAVNGKCLLLFRYTTATIN